MIEYKNPNGYISVFVLSCDYTVDISTFIVIVNILETSNEKTRTEKYLTIFYGNDLTIPQKFHDDI